MKRCLITGAADGIGRALAERFAAARYTIIGIDVDAERAGQTRTRLEAARAPVSFLIADLADRADLDRVLEILAAEPPVDVFIHNAGINVTGRFAGLALAPQKKVVQVNFLAPLLLTAGLLRRQKLRPGGALIFISSLSHFVSYPGAAVYAATKDGLASYARSLSVSLARQDIHVLTVYPGPTRTAHARRHSPDNRREQQRMPPEQLAEQIFQALHKRRRVLVPGLGNRALALIGRYFPSLAEGAMKKMILEKLRSIQV